MHARSSWPASIAFAAALTAGCKEAAPPPNPPPPDVQVVNVITRDVPVDMEGFGDTRGDADIRYGGGVADYLEVLDTQRVLYVSETDLARSRQNELQASVQLYRALGGGWSDQELLKVIDRPFDARK